MLIGLCPHLLLCFIYKTHLLKQFLIETMDIKQPESQESQDLPEAFPPHPPQATSTTSPYYHWDPHSRRTCRQHRTDQGWEEFLTALSAKDVELSDLDFGPQQELRSSPQARADFLALNLTSPEALHFGPDKANSRRLTSPRSNLWLTSNRSKLQHLSILEHYNTHIQIDTMDTRLKTLESTIDNKALLLRGLPATGFTMNNLDWNILLHEEQGPRGALGLSITMQQLFHHYQIDAGLTTDVHRRNNLIVQRPCPLCDYHLHFSKNERNSYQQILGSSFELTNILRFDYVVNELTNFINNSNLFQETFLGMDPCTNNELTHLSSVCTCFTDVAYWQFAHVFQLRPRDKINDSFRSPIGAKGSTTPLP